MQASQTKKAEARERSIVNALVALVAAVLVLLQLPAAGTHATVKEVEGKAFGYGGFPGWPAGGSSCDYTSSQSCSPSVWLASDASNSPQTVTDSNGAQEVSGSGVTFESSSMTVSTQGTLGPGGSVTSYAEATKVRAGPFTADSTRSECTATESGAEPKATIIGGKVVTSTYTEDDPATPVVEEPGDPKTIQDVPQNPLPNTGISGRRDHLNQNFTIFFNYTNSPSEDPALINIMVDAVYMSIDGDRFISESYCSVYSEEIQTDFTAPATPTLLSPPNGATTDDRTPLFDWSDVTDPSGVTYVIEVDNDPTFTSRELMNNGFATSDYTSTLALADGTYYWRVRAVDGARPASNASDWSTVSTVTVAGSITPGTPTLDYPDDGATIDTRKPMFDWWDVTTHSGMTYHLQVDNSGSSFPSPEIDQSGLSQSIFFTPDSLALAEGGPYAWRVRATSGAGNVGAWSSVFTFTVGPPTLETVVIGSPQDPTDNTPTFEFYSSSHPDATFECSLDGGAYFTCASPYTTGVLANGSHTFTVRAVDAAGNKDSSPTTLFFDINAPAAPDTTITSGPSATTTDNTPTFAFTSTLPDATFQCSLDGAAFTACTSPHTTGVLGNGSHTFSVQAIDAAGNVDPSPATTAFTVDVATTIIGTVTDARKKSGISGAIVDCGNGAKATTASNGSYTITISSVPPGTYTFTCTASATGYRSKSQNVTVNSGEEATADFALRKR